MVGRIPGPSQGNAAQMAALVLSKPHIANVSRSSAGSFTSLVAGLCTAWVWSGGGLGPSYGSGASMKTFPVAKGQIINWSADADGRVTLTTAGVNISPTVGTIGAAGVGVGGDINRSGTAIAGNVSGAGPDFSDTYMAIGAAGSGEAWRGGNGGTQEPPGGPSPKTPGGGGYFQEVDEPYTNEYGGLGRVILVFTGG